MKGISVGFALPCLPLFLPFGSSERGGRGLDVFLNHAAYLRQCF